MAIVLLLGRCVVTKVKERNSNRDEDVFSHSNTGGSNEEKPSPTRACVAKHLSSFFIPASGVT